MQAVIAKSCTTQWRRKEWKKRSRTTPSGKRRRKELARAIAWMITSAWTEEERAEMLVSDVREMEGKVLEEEELEVMSMKNVPASKV